ncbi:hypothetical protein ATI61_105138 [Archangium gephyra]|uniref:Uncharacterized protein n=1 Tax=Archangium gephyra TaxID=48 RepID=A0AAC8QG86_9BACT|nr:hypothetical protein [Archangium gephyra]AKJ06895.1 Hypothetical protein AA314_08521 [Archangium gephyra]REG31814.1 hypothetical protein ATI61_105138 [Archangium gephyra]
MADKPRIPTGRTKEPTHREAQEPTGANFQPRNAGELEDAIDAAAARVAQDINANARARAAENPGPMQDTSWEARVERGEEWEEQDDKDAVRNHDINEDVYKREAPSDQRDEKTASPVDRDRER